MAALQALNFGEQLTVKVDIQNDRLLNYSTITDGVTGRLIVELKTILEKENKTPEEENVVVVIETLLVRAVDKKRLLKKTTPGCFDFYKTLPSRSAILEALNTDLLYILTSFYKYKEKLSNSTDELVKYVNLAYLDKQGTNYLYK